MLGKDITAVFLHMGKLEQENRTLWSVTGQTRESSPYLANRFLRGFRVTKIKINNIKSMCLCYKSTMKKFKTYWFPSTKDLKTDTRSGNTRH